MSVSRLLTLQADEAPPCGSHGTQPPPTVCSPTKLWHIDLFSAWEIPGFKHWALALGCQCLARLLPGECWEMDSEGAELVKASPEMASYLGFLQILT